ncbi:MAG: cytochrome c [Cyclobacteriaceae bacterium]|nr:cytochrome c [Cyclobacteriaceae bacterium]
MKVLLMITLMLLSGLNLSTLDNNKDRSIKRGAEVYIFHCQRCHMPDGLGGENLYPPLSGSDYLFNNINQSIKIVMMGSDKDIIVNGKTHDMDMEATYLTDKEIADVMNFILNSWENSYEGIITEENVEAFR